MRQQYRERGVWSHHIITLARMRELHIEMEYGTGARSYILKWCQEPHFKYCIGYCVHGPTQCTAKSKNTKISTLSYTIKIDPINAALAALELQDPPNYT